jgi:flagellar basal-body rod protein FlgC
MPVMMTAIATARSGLLASVARLGAAASNIANADTIGPLPEIASAPSGQSGSGATTRAYEPIDVVLKSAGGADSPSGVAAIYRPRLPAYVRQYDPAAPFADANGMVAAPNVDLAEEAVDVLEASLLLRANLAVFKTATQMTRSILDATA